MIRSTIHHLKDLNLEKSKIYISFVEEYSRVCNLMIDQIWDELSEDLNVPKYFDYKKFLIDSPLSARALSSAITQASGIVRSVVEKQRRRLWIRKNANPNIKDVKISKPILGFISPSLSSKCCDILKEEGKFWGFVRIKCIGGLYGQILIPIIKHPRIKGEVKSGVMFNKHSLQLAWDIPTTTHAQGNKIIGIDQGLKTVATLSDGQTTPTQDCHGHSLQSIIGTLSRKKKGSKGFKKAQTHRKNFTNWSINQLDFSGLKEVRLEKIVNIGKGVRTSRSMSHWSNPEIRDKILKRCEELEVPITEQSCLYRSQRCNQCGLVRKANRKNKEYSCSCGAHLDADLNAAKNHICDLPPIPFSFRVLKYNIKGFYWNPKGIFNLDGSEIRVPDSYN